MAARRVERQKTLAIELEQGLALGDLRLLLDKPFGHAARKLGRDWDVHLHGLDDGHLGVWDNSGASFNQTGNQLSGDRRGDVTRHGDP